MLMSLSWNVFHPFQSGFGVYVTVQRGTPSMNPRHFEATFWKTIGPEWHFPLASIRPTCRSASTYYTDLHSASLLKSGSKQGPSTK